MFGGGGGLNPRKMQQMMEQMGIEMDELDAEEVLIRLEDGSELVFDDADVTKMEARDQETYQIVGEPETRAGDDEASDGSGGSSEDEIPEDDVALVAERTGTSAEAARDALEAEDGDLAAAISRLE